ncbi:MAG: type II CAAX prenyl endopeptidase Rce1 family protein [Candidatus Odinarchaeota archaeon]
MSDVVKQETTEILGNFSTPASIATSCIILQLALQVPLSTALYFVPLTDNLIVISYLVALVSQILCVILIYLLIIPRLGIRAAKYKKVEGTSLIRALVIFCLAGSILIIISLGFAFLFPIMNEGSNAPFGMMMITNIWAGNLLDLVIYASALTIGPALFGEVLFRRVLIPLLEDRGMSPLTAATASSLAFALFHIPAIIVRNPESISLYQVLSRISTLIRFGSLNILTEIPALFLSYLGIPLITACMYFLSAFILGMACAITYILTRNVILALFIHSFGNLLLLSTSSMMSLDGGIVTIVLILMMLIIIITGFITFIRVLKDFRAPDPDRDWVISLKEKSRVKTKTGLVKYLLLFLAGVIFVVFYQTIAGFIPFTFVASLSFYGMIFFFVFRSTMKKVTAETVVLTGGSEPSGTGTGGELS